MGLDFGKWTLEFTEFAVRMDLYSVGACGILDKISTSLPPKLLPRCKNTGDFVPLTTCILLPHSSYLPIQDRTVLAGYMPMSKLYVSLSLTCSWYI